MPLFSVLMSVYNKENPKFLAECLDSILVNQTCLPTEVVMVKDGLLTDDLEKVIEAYQQRFSYLKTVTVEGGRGLYHALNMGLQSCSNEWIVRMDTDDVAYPTRFEQQFDYLKQHTNIDVLGSSITEFNTTIGEYNGAKLMPEKHEDIVKMSQLRNPINHMTVVYRKSDVLKLGGYIKAPYMEDYYLWVRMLAAGFMFANIPSPLVYARIGNGMYKRRGRLSQLSGKIIINNFMLKHKKISLWQYALGLSTTVVLIILPNCMRKVIYMKILRK